MNHLIENAENVVVELHCGFLRFWSKMVGKPVSKEEYDLLSCSVINHDDNDLMNCFSYRKRTPQAVATYEKLHEKILASNPQCTLSKEISFIDDDFAKQNADIDPKTEAIYSKPTPIDQICPTDKLCAIWFQNDASGYISIMRLRLRESFAEKLSRALIANADSDSFRWLNHELTDCCINIESAEHLMQLLGDLAQSENQADQNDILKLQDILSCNTNVIQGKGINIALPTKAKISQ